MKSVKVSSAVITLGDTEIEVYKLPDGSYLYGATHIANAIEIRSSRVAEICATKEAQSLAQKGIGVADFSSTPVVTDTGKGRGYRSEAVMFVWQHEAFKGNKIAQAILFAGGNEMLDRRSDAAFGIKRTEEERNEKFRIRREGILSRHFWTDVIDRYIKEHPELSEDYRNWIYVNVSDYLNKALFGMKASEARRQLGIEGSIRDFLPSSTLKLIDTIEKAAGTRVVNTNSCPKQALKDVVSVLGVSADQSLLSR